MSDGRRPRRSKRAPVEGAVLVEKGRQRRELGVLDGDELVAARAVQGGRPVVLGSRRVRVTLVRRQGLAATWHESLPLDLSPCLPPVVTCGRPVVRRLIPASTMPPEAPPLRRIPERSRVASGSHSRGTPTYERSSAATDAQPRSFNVRMMSLLRISIARWTPASAGGAQAVRVGAADQHGPGTHRERLDDVAATANPPVHHDLDAAIDRGDHLRQHTQCRRHAVELTAPVIRHHDRVGARVDRAPRVLGRVDALDDDRAPARRRESTADRASSPSTARARHPRRHTASAPCREARRWESSSGRRPRGSPPSQRGCETSPGSAGSIDQSLPDTRLGHPVSHVALAQARHRRVDGDDDRREARRAGARKRGEGDLAPTDEVDLIPGRALSWPPSRPPVACRTGSRGHTPCPPRPRPARPPLPHGERTSGCCPGGPGRTAGRAWCRAPWSEGRTPASPRPTAGAASPARTPDSSPSA